MRRGVIAAVAVSWPVKRSLILFAVGIVTGVASAFVWPGDLNNEPMTGAHWVAVGGFLVTAVLLVLAAVMLFFGVTGAAWKVDDFDLDEYFDDMKKDR